MNQLTIPSLMENLEKVNAFIEEVKISENLSDDIYSAIMLTVNEAASNAILHGNKLDPSKMVSVAISSTNEEVNITICDQGNGFNPDDLPDPLDEANLLKAGGRGIFIIRAYADDVQFEDEGRCMKLTFKKS